MSHIYRFIGEKLNDSHWQLNSEESHHVAKVLRLAAGIEVEVTDLNGTVAKGSLQEISAKKVTVAVDSTSKIERPLHHIGVIVGALRPGSIDEVLAPLTELGVTDIVVFHQKETAKQRVSEKVQERWQRILVQSVKQCKRPFLPRLHVENDLGAALNLVPSDDLKMVLDPVGQPLLSLIQGDQSQKGCWVVAGGEKGLSEAELGLLAQAGYSRVSLCNGILRAKTAVVSAASLLAAVFCS